MLRLTLWNFAETTQHTIELYQNAPVNLNYQFTDVTQINKTKGSYTQTFRVPATKINTDFFGALSDPAVQTSSSLIIDNYSVKKRIRAEINYNSVPLMRGYVQVKAVYRQKKDFADIELVFFGETVDMTTKVGDKMLTDLTTSTIDHGLNNAEHNGSLSRFYLRQGTPIPQLLLMAQPFKITICLHTMGILHPCLAQQILRVK